MQSRIALVLACVATLLAATTTATAAPAAAAPAASPAGPVLVAGDGVRLQAGGTAARAGRLAAAVPPSFCYVRVSQPQLGPGLILTASWALDCRSGANSNRPATDIDMTDMTVRIYQGDPAFGEAGTNVASQQCFSHGPTAGCSASTSSPIQYGIPYYSKLVVIVYLLDGTSFSGSFVTAASRLS
jgi:hypothetical protein